MTRIPLFISLVALITLGACDSVEEGAAVLANVTTVGSYHITSSYDCAGPGDCWGTTGYFQNANTPTSIKTTSVQGYIDISIDGANVTNSNACFGQLSIVYRSTPGATLFAVTVAQDGEITVDSSPNGSAYTLTNGDRKLTGQVNMPSGAYEVNTIFYPAFPVSNGGGGSSSCAKVYTQQLGA